MMTMMMEVMMVECFETSTLLNKWTKSSCNDRSVVYRRDAMFCSMVAMSTGSSTTL